MNPRPSAVRFQVSDPSAPPGRDLLHEYVGEILTRFDGRPPSAAHRAQALAGDHNDTLVAPHGTFLVAFVDDRAVGCGGLRFLDAHVGEIKRLYVRPTARGQKLGSALLVELEAEARARELTTLRLDTRHELHEAHALYERHGYGSIRRYNDSTLADLWLEKTLVPET